MGGSSEGESRPAFAGLGGGSWCRGKGHMGMNYGGLRVGLEMG